MSTAYYSSLSYSLPPTTVAYLIAYCLLPTTVVYLIAYCLLE